MTQPPPSPAPEVSIDELESHLSTGGLAYDVREPNEFADGHVPGVIPLPMSALRERWQEIPADKGTVQIVCATGHRSLNVATALREAGIDAVSVAGGTVAWARSGRPIET